MLISYNIDYLAYFDMKNYFKVEANKLEAQTVKLVAIMVSMCISQDLMDLDQIHINTLPVHKVIALFRHDVVYMIEI